MHKSILKAKVFYSFKKQKKELFFMVEHKTSRFLML